MEQNRPFPESSRISIGKTGNQLTIPSLLSEKTPKNIYAVSLCHLVSFRDLIVLYSSIFFPPTLSIPNQRPHAATRSVGSYCSNENLPLGPGPVGFKFGETWDPQKNWQHNATHIFHQHNVEPHFWKIHKVWARFGPVLRNTRHRKHGDFTGQELISLCWWITW